jgi:RNA polymerase sigma factor (sigma-70 family)
MESPQADRAAHHAFEECREELHRFLVRRLRGRQEIRDLMQEVYVRFLQTPQRELVRQPMAYLYRIAANLIHDVHARERLGAVTFDSEVVEETTERRADVWAGDLGDRLSAERQVERVLAQLPAMYQAVLLLRKRDGLSSAEIAKELGISKHTAEKYLYRAIAHFREAQWDL